MPLGVAVYCSSMVAVRQIRRLLRPARRVARLVANGLAQRFERVATVEYEGVTLYYPSRSTVGPDLVAAAAGTGSAWPETSRALMAMLEGERPFVVDVGSNVGSTLLQIKLAKPAASVLCVEPSPRYAPCLRMTIEANGWQDDVQLVEQLVGAVAGEATLYSSTGTGSVVARNYGPFRPVRADRLSMTTLDLLLEDRTPALVKIDTDGYDFDVLLGAEQLLRRAHPPLYFEFAPFLIAQGEREPAELPTYLAGLGYERFLVLPAATAARLTSDPAEVADLADRNQYADVLALPASPSRLGQWAESVAAG